MSAPHVDFTCGVFVLRPTETLPGIPSGQLLEGDRWPPRDAVNVILYCLLGEIQVRGNFFIRQTLRNQGDQLLLPARQAEFKFNSRAWNGCPLPRNRAE